MDEAGHTAAFAGNIFACIMVSGVLLSYCAKFIDAKLNPPQENAAPQDAATPPGEDAGAQQPGVTLASKVSTLGMAAYALSIIPLMVCVTYTYKAGYRSGASV